MIAVILSIPGTLLFGKVFAILQMIRGVNIKVLASGIILSSVNI